MRLQTLFREPMILWESQDYASILNPLKKLDPKADWSNEEEKIEQARRILKRSDRIMWWLRWWRLALVKEIVTYKTLPSIDNGVLQRLLDDYSRKAGKTVLAKNVPEKRFIQGRLETFAHYLSLPIPAIQNRVFGFEHPSEIVEEFAAAERQWQEQASEDDPKRRFAYDPNLAKKEEVLIAFPDGTEWINTNLANCDREAGAMTHCGNRPRSHTKDKLLSLRRYVDPTDMKPVRRTEQGWRRDDGELHYDVAVVPMLTFILDEDGNLGEMKGPKNNKPGSRHYPHIVALLRQPFVKGIVQGHWASENDFKLAWLPEATQDELWNEKPALFHGSDLVTMLTRRPDLPISGDIAKKLKTPDLFNLVMTRPDADLTYDMLKRFRDEIAPSHLSEFIRARPDLSIEQKLMLLKDGDAVHSFLMASPEITDVSHIDLVMKLATLPATKMKTLLASRQFSRDTYIALAKYDGEFLNYVYGKSLDRELAEIAAANSNDAKRILKRIPKKLQNASIMRAYWTKLSREGEAKDITAIPHEFMTPEAAFNVLSRQLRYGEVKPSQIESLVPRDVWQSEEIQRLYYDTRAESEFHLKPSDMPSPQHASDWTIITMCIRHPSVIAEMYDAGRITSDMAWRMLTINETSRYDRQPTKTINFRTLVAAPPEMILNLPQRSAIEDMLANEVGAIYSRSSLGEPRKTKLAAEQIMRIFGKEMLPRTANMLLRHGFISKEKLPDEVLDRMGSDDKDHLPEMATTWEELARKWPSLHTNTRIHIVALLTAHTGRMRLDLLKDNDSLDVDAPMIGNAGPPTGMGFLTQVLTKLYHMEFEDHGIFHDLERAGLATPNIREALANIGLMPVKEMTERELEIAKIASRQMQGLNRRFRFHPSEMRDLPLPLQRVATRYAIFQKKLWRYTDPRAVTDEMMGHALDQWRMVHEPQYSNLRDEHLDDAPSTDEFRKWVARVPMNNLKDSTLDSLARRGFRVAPASDDGFPVNLQGG